MLFLLILLAGGCNGVIYQKQTDSGQTSRVIINKDDGWDSLNITPRDYNQKDQSDYGLMLKNEYTF